MAKSKGTTRQPAFDAAAIATCFPAAKDKSDKPASPSEAAPDINRDVSPSAEAPSSKAISATERVGIPHTYHDGQNGRFANEPDL